ncbi:MAG TPA: isoprenylcysteine carboxylmethyltransferase family protein [Jatrophihabitans sp.]
MSAGWYTVLIAAVAVERLVELVLARRNQRWLLAQGAVERGAAHYPVMVVLHVGLLVGALAEVWLAPRQFIPALGWPALAVVVAAQALRWWCIRTLGRRWNTRVLVVPGLDLVGAGPYRLMPHPNYLAVVAEGVALPLVHDAWMTAIVFSVLNAVLLRTRIRVENEALRRLSPLPPIGVAVP